MFGPETFRPGLRAAPWDGRSPSGLLFGCGLSPVGLFLASSACLGQLHFSEFGIHASNHFSQYNRKNMPSAVIQLTWNQGG